MDLSVRPLVRPPVGPSVTPLWFPRISQKKHSLDWFQTWWFVHYHYCDAIMGTIASEITSLTIVYTTVYSDAEQSKHQSSASLAFVWGIHRDRWIPRTKGQLRGKCFHLMTSSWWYSQGLVNYWLRSADFLKQFPSNLKFGGYIHYGTPQTWFTLAAFHLIVAVSWPLVSRAFSLHLQTKPWSDWSQIWFGISLRASLAWGWGWGWDSAKHEKSFWSCFAESQPHPHPQTVSYNSVNNFDCFFLCKNLAYRENHHFVLFGVFFTGQCQWQFDIRLRRQARSYWVVK